MRFLRLRPLVFTAALGLATVGLVGASYKPVPAQAPNKAAAAPSNEPNLTEDQMRQFLLTAKVIKSKQTSKGVTAPYRLTLSDGTLTHDASFQPIDETKTMMQFARGTTEMNFRDSWHFNIAAFEIAKLLGLGDMMPVTVERKWEGKSGSLTWWLPVQMDEADRLKQKIQPPDPEAWNKQMYRMRVFSQLVYDTDRNLTNVLIGHDWKLYMIDFSRAFRLHKELENAKNLVKCDRQLLEKLRQLDATEVEQKTKGHLRKSEIQGLMARRDKIVAYFQQLIAQQGENAVLY
jgi:hypothetical protein